MLSTRSQNVVVDLEGENTLSPSFSTNLSVSEKLDVICTSLMARVTTLERRDLQVEQQFSKVGGLEMRMQNLEEGIGALIDGLPRVRSLDARRALLVRI
eukprot:3555628-Amphidinium_carterae.2